MDFHHARQALSGKLWYVHEQKMNEILAFFELLSGDSGDSALAALRAQRVEAARASAVQAGNSGKIAVIPIHGMITHRGSVFSYFFGGGSTEDITQALRLAVNDPTVSAIVLDIDSPGGDVDGVDELATEIYQARKQKPVTAVSNCLCASAAYYLGSQASELIASPSSLTGSIGVYTLHQDASEMLENAGIKMTLIKFGENKAEGNPFEPLSDPAREHLQEMVDTYGNDFEKAVARGRGMKQDDVHKKFGQGRVFDAKKAVKLGMADRVGTLDDALMKHGAARGSSGRRAMATQVHTIEGELISTSLNADGTRTLVFAAAKKKRGDVGDPDDDCDCECSPCQGGDCKACSCEDCACEGCACDAAAGARRKKARVAHADSDDACACDCKACKGGDCKECTCESCVCDGCACDWATNAKRKKAHARMQRELELAALS